MPSSHTLILLLLFCGLIWYVRDFITVLALLFLIYQWMIEDNAGVKPDSIPDRLRKMLYPQSNNNSDRDGAGAEGYRRRPLLYESDTQVRRRYTESDIRLPPELLTPDEPEPDNLYPDTLRGLLNPESRVRHGMAAASNIAQPPNKQRRVQSAGRQRSDPPQLSDGVYRAVRAVSVEELPPLEGDDSLYEPDYDETGLVDYYDSGADESDDDEFFLATDFADPLPKSDYTQSVDYLDDIINEERHAESELEKAKRR